MSWLEQSWSFIFLAIGGLLLVIVSVAIEHQSFWNVAFALGAMFFSIGAIGTVTMWAIDAAWEKGRQSALASKPEKPTTQEFVKDLFSELRNRKEP